MTRREEGNPHKLTPSGKVTPKAEISETDDVFLSTLKGMRRVTGLRCWQFRYGYVPPVHLSHGGASFTQEHDFMILQSSSNNVMKDRTPYRVNDERVQSHTDPGITRFFVRFVAAEILSDHEDS